MSSVVSDTRRLVSAADADDHGLAGHSRAPGWLCWLTLLLVLVVCIPPMLVGLGARDSTHTMENVALVVSQETWLRAHSPDEFIWYLTYNDERVRIVKPPLVTWQQMLAWRGLDPDTATPAELILRARLMAVAMGGLTIAAVFWSGLTLADLRLAAAAALAAGTTIFLQRQARTASYDIHFTAWAALSVAAGLWAMAPRSSVLRWARVCLGWLLCGVLLAAATASKNPLSFVVVLVPLVLAVAVLPRRRGRNAVGVLVAALLAAAIVAPWYIAVQDVVNNAGAKLLTEFQAEREHAQPVYYYLGLIPLVAPWPVWLLAGLAHPYVDGRRLGLPARLFVWLWFIAIFITFSIPAAKQQRYILPIMPAAALLIGFVWRDHKVLLRRGAAPGGYGLGVVIHGVSLLAVSIGFGFFLGWQRVLLGAFGEETEPELVLGEVTWAAALIVTAILGALAITAWRFHARRRPMRCMCTTAVWAALFLSVMWWTYGRAPSGDHPIRPIARNLRALVDDAPIRSLRLPEVDDASMLNEEFRIYFGRRIKWIAPDELASFAQRTGGGGYVLARDTPQHEQALLDAGYLPAREVRTDKHVTQVLWQRPRDEP